MKVFLILAAGLGLLLLAGLAFFWRSDSGAGVSSTPGTAGSAEAGGESAKLLPVGTGERAEPEPDALKPASERPPAVPSALPASPVTYTNGQSVITPLASGIDSQPDNDGFATKYAGLDESGYKEALELVEKVIQEQRQGPFSDKNPQLPAEAIAALERESQWLKEHAYP
jgi:hypothetical protein